MIKHRLLLLFFYQDQVECETFDPQVWSVETRGVPAVWASLTGGQIIFREREREREREGDLIN